MSDSVKTRKALLIGCILAAVWGFAAIGCEKEGPAEKAGKKVDEALDSAKKAFKKLTDE